MNQPGSHSNRSQVEATNVGPPSQVQGDQALANPSKSATYPESGDILTRKLPESRHATQPIAINVGQPTIIVPNGTNQMLGPQIPQGNPQIMQQGVVQPGMMQPGMMQPGMMQPGMIQPGMNQPGMILQGGQAYPRYPPGNQIPGQPQLPPGQGGYPTMGQPQLPPGSQMRTPQFNGMTPGRPQFHNDNRFENDNRGLQNLKDGNQSDGTYASTQICCKQFGASMATWLPCCCIGTNPYKIVPEGFAGVIRRFGKFYKLVGPGMHYILDEVDNLDLVDVREKVVELKQQSVVSRDNTSFRVDAVLYYRATNVYKSRFSVSNVAWALQDLASTTLRNVVGRMTMQQFLEAKEHLAEQIEGEIAHIAEKWGAHVKRVLVQDVYLPQEFRNSFSTSAVAKRISEAQIINSKAEVEVARLMRDAADALSTDAAFQIRYIDAIEVLSKSANPKMIFFPADYTDVGTANTDLLSTMTDEMETLLRNR